MAAYSTAETGGRTYVVSWTLTTADPTGTGISFAGAPDKTVTFVGGASWGSATAAIEGSNDGTNWLPLTDPQGNAISKTSDSIEAVLENPLYIRARLTTPGTAASVLVQICVRGAR